MNKRWSAILATLSLSAAYACSDSDVSPPSTSNGGSSGAAGAHAGRAAHAGGGGGNAGGLAGTSGGDAGEGGSAAGHAGVDAGASGQGGQGGQGGESGEGGPASGLSGSGGEAGSSVEPVDQPLGSACKGCQVTVLKSPVWKLSGAVMSVAPVGAPEAGGAPFYEWLSTLSSPTHELYPEGVYGPGAPHSAPYESEPFALFSAGNVTVKQQFTVDEFGPPNGVALVLTAVPLPSAPTGTSPDFASGPIIPNALFPIFVDGDLFRNGAIYDDAFDGPYPGFQSFDPPIVKNGASHLVFNFAENSGFGPPVDPKGNYVFHISFIDASEAGWIIDVPFVVQ